MKTSATISRPASPRPNAKAGAGEAEGLKVSLARANDKLAQAAATAARRAEAVSLGIPSYRDIGAATLTSPGDRDDR